MTVVNGKVSPTTLVVQAAQDAKARFIAELEHTIQTAKIVAPQMEKIGEEIARLEALKFAKETEARGCQVALDDMDAAIEVQETALELAKKTKEKIKKAKQKSNAQKKARGGEAKESDNGNDTEIQKMRDAIEEQKKARKKVSDKMEDFQKQVKEYEESIKALQKQLNILGAQISPDVAVAEAKVKTEQAKQKVDKASTPEDKKAAESELKEAQQEEQILQQVADDKNSDVENIQEQQEPKRMQLRAEYQFMDMGVKAFQYLFTNMSIQAPLPSFIGTGSPNPARTIADGNVNYGILFFILGALKASAIRFMAIAQEINYTPDAEMAIINMIPACEVQLNTYLGFGPAGAALNV